MLKLWNKIVFFTTSVIQFSFTLTSNQSKRGHSCSALFFGTEIWALCFILSFQELPFLVIRSLKLLRFEQSVTDYTVYFFTVKNLVLCLFEIYRIGVIYFHHRKKSKNTSNRKSLKNNKATVIDSQQLSFEVIRF